MNYLIRGFSKNEIEFLKALAEKENRSLNQFLLKTCREKIEHGEFHSAEKIYLSHLENMKEASDFMLVQSEKQLAQLEQFERKISSYAAHISRWLEYEGEVEVYDKGD